MTPALFFYSTLDLKKQLLFYSVKIPSNLHQFKLVSPASHKCLPDIKADIMLVRLCCPEQQLLKAGVKSVKDTVIPIILSSHRSHPSGDLTH